MEVLVEFDYIAQNIDEIDIKKGERIRNVIQKEEGWYEGELAHSGKIGLFPDNFVKVNTFLNFYIFLLFVLIKFKVE